MFSDINLVYYMRSVCVDVELCCVQTADRMYTHRLAAILLVLSTILYLEVSGVESPSQVEIGVVVQMVVANGFCYPTLTHCQVVGYNERPACSLDCRRRHGSGGGTCWRAFDYCYSCTCWMA